MLGSCKRVAPNDSICLSCFIVDRCCGIRGQRGVPLGAKENGDGQMTNDEQRLQYSEGPKEGGA